MDEAHKTIIERMKGALDKIISCDFYIGRGNLTPHGKRNLAKAIIEYDSLARTSGDSQEIKKLQENYEDIRETYELR